MNCRNNRPPRRKIPGLRQIRLDKNYHLLICIFMATDYAMRKIIPFAIAFILCAFNCFAQQNSQSIKDFGAKGDGVSDDTQAFMKAVQSAQTLIIPKGIYNVKGPMAFNNLQNKVIILQGAVIRNTDNTKATLMLTGCTNVAIHGGTWTYASMPTGNGYDVAIRITTCRNIEITHTHVLGSSEQGIVLVCVIGANISNNVIEQCFRDGIYSHYSSNLIYACNYIHDIKDDAMSIHDYGIPAQRCILNDAGIPQAGNSIVFNNITKNTYEGFSSIGCTRLFIANNNIQNTVTGGISIFNSENLFKGSTARANRIVISGNKLSGCGGKPKIIGAYYGNNGQVSTGRAAIFVGVLDSKDQISNPQSRIQYVTVTNNTVTNCFENGAYLAQIDHLNVLGNTFRNNNISRSEYDGSEVEIQNCNAVTIDKNSVSDNRTSTESKDHSYSLDGVNGNMGSWSINSSGASPSTTNSSLKGANELSRDVKADVPGFSLKPGEYKIIRQKFSTGVLTDCIDLLPASSNSQLACNAFTDPTSGMIVVVIANNGKQNLDIPGGSWTVREFYHN